MEELAKIITTLSLITGVDRVSIVTGAQDVGRKARHILCYVVRNGYPHLMRPLKEMTGLAESSVHTYARSISKEAQENDHIMRILKAVERSLKVKPQKEEPPKEAPKKKEKPKTVRRKYPKWNPFGLTPLDDIRRHAAIRSANEFMRKFCKVGLQPIAEGMVYSRRKEKNARQWLV